LIRRIDTLNADSRAQWGKMNVFQMTRHCTRWDEMIISGAAYKQAFIGRLFGRMALKSLTKDEKPLRRNTPTLRELKITSSGDVPAEKAKWIALMEQYAHYSHNDFMHPFFGKMTKEETGILAYKHTDHHLRQFNS
jgi:hypothetical protein